MKTDFEYDIGPLNVKLSKGYDWTKNEHVVMVLITVRNKSKQYHAAAKIPKSEYDDDRKVEQYQKEMICNLFDKYPELRR